MAQANQEVTFATIKEDYDALEGIRNELGMVYQCSYESLYNNIDQEVNVFSTRAIPGKENYLQGIADDLQSIQDLVKQYVQASDYFLSTQNHPPNPKFAAFRQDSPIKDSKTNSTIGNKVRLLLSNPWNVPKLTATFAVSEGVSAGITAGAGVNSPAAKDFLTAIPPSMKEFYANISALNVYLTATVGFALIVSIACLVLNWKTKEKQIDTNTTYTPYT
jgi:hypothetical protein